MQLTTGPRSHHSALRGGATVARCAGRPIDPASRAHELDGDQIPNASQNRPEPEIAGPQASARFGSGSVGVGCFASPSVIGPGRARRGSCRLGEGWAGARIGAWACRSRSLIVPVTLKFQLPGWDHRSGLLPVSGRQSHRQASDGRDRGAIGRRCCPCPAAHDGVSRARVCFYPVAGLDDDVGLGAGGILPVGCCSFTCGGARWSNADGNVGEEGQGRSA
jgi:hypothetical protein